MIYIIGLDKILRWVRINIIEKNFSIHHHRRNCQMWVNNTAKKISINASDTYQPLIIIILKDRIHQKLNEWTSMYQDLYNTREKHCIFYRIRNVTWIKKFLWIIIHTRLLLPACMLCTLHTWISYTNECT